MSNMLGVAYCKCPAEGSIHPFSTLCESEILARKQLSLIEEGQHHVSEEDHNSHAIPEIFLLSSFSRGTLYSDCGS